MPIWARQAPLQKSDWQVNEGPLNKTTVARHTHPGVESAFLMEGEVELEEQGKPTRRLKAGEGFQIPPATPHGGRSGPQRARLAITYVVEKDKPLASPAPG